MLRTTNALMKKGLQVILLGLILLVAAILRFRGLDWDDFQHYHPDERYIVWVATSIEWPQDWGSAFAPQSSTFNPFYWPANATSQGIVLERAEPRRFAYGHLPLYLDVLLTRGLEQIGPAVGPLLPANWSVTQDLLNLAGRIEFRHLLVAGRALTGLIDLGTVALIFVLGKLMFAPEVGLLAAAFLALNVMHIQLAHFFTVDPYLTFFVLAAIVFMVLALRAGRKRRWRSFYVLLAAVAIGLAAGSKFGGVLLLLPLAATVLLDGRRELAQKALLLVVACVLVLLVFSVTNPFAVLDFSCTVDAPLRVGPLEIPKRYLGSCYMQNLALQGSMVRGLRDVPFVRQYAGTTPFLYYVEMQLRWGMGPLLGLISFLGFGWAIWRVVQGALNWRRRRRNSAKHAIEDDSFRLTGARYRLTMAEPVVLAWTLPFFLTTGALDVKFIRYMQPLVPFLMLYAAAMLLSWHRVAFRRVAAGLILAITAVYALAFVSIYARPHPWIAASEWIYNYVSPDAFILNEAWDDPLPDGIELDGERRRRSEYRTEDVNWLSGTGVNDGEEKLRQNLDLLSQADYLVLSSNRNYGVIPRLPDRYPNSSQYYPLLFAGDLGYEVVYAGTRMPSFLGLYLKTDSFAWPELNPPQPVADFFDSLPGFTLGRFDESFTVYDQPLVIIFANSGRLSAEEMAELFAIS
jgi:4-amino-4-deoxy-L-arabinose transferase-like glycosyltransferase